MHIQVNLSSYTQWSAYLTIALLVLTILGLILKWGIRFRLVGITGFMVVLTIGLFGLGWGLLTRTAIPNALRYSLVYDSGANQAVIALPPYQVSESVVEATLRQAADDLFSPGRLGLGGDQMIIRLRTMLHTQPGVSKPLYLGQVKRSLVTRNNQNLEIEVFSDNLAQLPANPNSETL
jgi:Protein of function (DUF2518)